MEQNIEKQNDEANWQELPPTMLVDTISSDNIIPIHSLAPYNFKEYFNNLNLVDDGEIVDL